ncbi:MAG: heavy metal translocating P-type ATPase [Sulfurospirillaceae bacterium]|nr:heavy metal translocating P-type ATPase [Sulfurospirillaceae bacterium]
MSKRRCDHCHLEYDESILLKDLSFGQSPKYFCCKGCQGVYHLLKSEGLDSFYAKMGDTTLEPPKDTREDSGTFDLDGFISKYVKKCDGLSEIYLVIEGIHCSACVWLNEKVLSKKEGIVEVVINHTNSKAKVVWDMDMIKLSQIIETIRSIGYNAYPYDPSIQEDRANAMRKEYYAKLLVGVFATMNIMWIAIAQYEGYFSGMRQDIKNILNFAEFVLATPVLFYTGSVYFKGAYFALKNRFVSMDVLVASGASLAYAFSVYAMLSKNAEVYFDSVAMIVTFVFAGKYLEVLGRKKAVDVMDSFSSTMPLEATLVKGYEKVLVPVESLHVDDILEVKAGEQVVVDGEIVSGEGFFDTSKLSGESKPIYRSVGDKILSGYVSLDSVLRYKALSDFSSSTFSKIVSLLSASMDKKPFIEKMANTISGYFSLVVLGLALLTFVGWFVGFGSFEKALIVAISVIVIACPCALGLATPVATVVGIGSAVKQGILFKEASFLETMAKCDTLILDKTGTITQGKPTVLFSQYFDGFEPSLLYALVANSTHPISKGVALYARENFNNEIKNISLESVKSIDSRGVEARYKGARLLGGNLKLMQSSGVVFEEEVVSEDMTLFFFAINAKLVAVFGLQDSLRDGAKETIEALKKMGLDIVMLTGDILHVAQDIAQKVGIKRFEYSLLPSDKAEYIDKLRDDGKKIVMVGDGINDVLALSKSEVAIAMGSGTDVAVNVSDVVIGGDSFFALYEAFFISKKVYRIIRENIAFSVVYNTIMIPLAMFGFIMPLFAALSMSLSSLVVVVNSMRIGSIRKIKKG